MTKGQIHASILATTIAASFGFGLIQLDVTIVNVALPTIAKTLNTTVAGLQWVVDAYALVFAALLLTGGYFGDRFGAKRCYLAGITLFAIASLMCGVAPSATLLIAGRMFQGVGAALMLPCSLALINHAAEGQPQRRAQAIGWWTAAGGIMIAAGPIIGGLLLGAASWRSIFLVNLPVCVIGVLFTLKVVETNRLPDGRGVDVVGQLLGMVALGAITGAMIEAKPLGLESPVVLVCATIGIVAAVAFVRYEARSPAPMLPLSLFGSRAFCGAVIFGAIVNFTYYGAVFVLSLYLQRVLGYSPVAAGLAFLPLTATFLIVNIISGWWAGAMGSRAPMIAGALIDAGGFALLAFVAAETVPYWQLAIAFVLIPAGMGLGVPAMTTAVLASIGRERSGIASAVLNAARQAAGAMGVALFGTLAGDAPSNVVAGLRMSATIAAVLLIAAAALAATTIARHQRGAHPCKRGSIA
ncbi:DHA2 family methylenomycin A resistance protein-like MFS transporter [Mesorhizobium soli]|uniref:MFS transporter n=1 Tax=Pseudaminobacter soli (ex Li et al. 2025) TaxID=1295366 RepID=UPI002475DEE6|nr:MFS transporter [Mesorhizobium soli]MDH6232199.1 DHA2 family methylenomycin A resistance protein-like MFS transporter [Mesorhizobium soli]